MRHGGRYILHVCLHTSHVTTISSNIREFGLGVNFEISDFITGYKIRYFSETISNTDRMHKELHVYNHIINEITAIWDHAGIQVM